MKLPHFFTIYVIFCICSMTDSKNYKIKETNQFLRCTWIRVLLLLSSVFFCNILLCFCRWCCMLHFVYMSVNLVSDFSFMKILFQFIIVFIGLCIQASSILCAQYSIKKEKLVLCRVALSLQYTAIWVLSYICPLRFPILPIRAAHTCVILVFLLCWSLLLLLFKAVLFVWIFNYLEQ